MTRSFSYAILWILATSVRHMRNRHVLLFRSFGDTPDMETCFNGQFFGLNQIFESILLPIPYTTALSENCQKSI